MGKQDRWGLAHFWANVRKLDGNPVVHLGTLVLTAESGRATQQRKEKRMSYINNGARAVRRSVQGLICSLMPLMVFAGPVDVNKADASTIAKELNGIGLKHAQAIVAYREKNGAFKSAEDLRKVKGIGAKTLERNRSNIRLSSTGEGKSGA
jgi:competence protein ComEA